MSALYKYHTIVEKAATSYKELFRQEAITRGVACFCVIDKETYSELSCITGCFQKGTTWTVYNTNERGAVYNERFFSDEKKAYSDLANRLGFVLSKNNPSEYHVEVHLKKTNAKQKKYGFRVKGKNGRVFLKSTLKIKKAEKE